MRTAVPPAVVLVGVLLMPLATADDGWRNNARRLEVVHGADGFEMRSDRIAAPGQDRIRLRFAAPDVNLSFEHLEPPDAGQSDATLDVELRRVVEFRDNGDGRLGLGDAIEQEFNRSDLVPSGLTVENLSANGVPGVQVTATYGFGGGASLGFRATAFGDLTPFEGVEQSPVEIRVDLLLSGFPYAQGNTTAIELGVRGKAPGRPTLPPNSVSFETGTLTATFSWMTTASGDGAESPVGTTVTSLGEATLSVSFAYARGLQSVDHAAKFAITPGDGALEPVGDWAPYAAGGVLALAVFLVLFAITRKGRRGRGAEGQ